MSQAKVDRYKAEKANRKKNLKKEKMKRNIAAACGTVVGIAVIGWIGYSAYGYFHSSPNSGSTNTAQTTEIDVNALNDYLSGVSNGTDFTAE